MEKSGTLRARLQGRSAGKHAAHRSVAITNRKAWVAVAAVAAVAEAGLACRRARKTPTVEFREDLAAAGGPAPWPPTGSRAPLWGGRGGRGAGSEGWGRDFLYLSCLPHFPAQSLLPPLLSYLKSFQKHLLCAAQRGQVAWPIVGHSAQKSWVGFQPRCLSSFIRMTNIVCISYIYTTYDICIIS